MHWLLPLQKSPMTHAVSEMQEVGHAPPVPLHTYGAQDGRPALPCARLVHVPSSQHHHD